MNAVTSAQTSFPLAGPVSRVLALFGVSMQPGAILVDVSDPELLQRVLSALQAGHKRLFLFSATDRPAHRRLQRVAPDAVVVTGPSLRTLLEAGMGRPRPSEFDVKRLERWVAARLLHDEVREFSHGSNRDIANQLLAPLRILADIEASEAAAFWSVNLQFLASFRSALEKRPDEGWGYREELKAALESLSVSADEREWSDVSAACSRVMDLMTDIRQAAGDNSLTLATLQRSRVCSNDAEADPNTGHLVLVIDDHSDEWEKVFRKLIEERPSLHIMMSRDGVTAKSLNNPDEERRVAAILPDCDLVLLDIHLRGAKTGLDLLSDIRQRLRQLPVVLWTTSTAKELPAQANLANGFLFKKTTSLDQIRRTFGLWLAVGRSHRMWSLPNPFFDHVLVTSETRECALDFTKWTLRYMDCFHALDRSYFRYFNDHGGRHVLGVLDSVARLLRPFLMPDPNRPVGLFDDDEKRRESQLLSLYIAVLCHEFGMFPVFKTDKADNDWEQLNHVRKLHAIRGLVMLECIAASEGGCDVSVEGAPEHVALLNQYGIRGAVSLLVGYHQRCLDLKGMPPDFEAVNIDAVEKLNKASARVARAPAWTDTKRVGKAWEAAWEDSRSLFSAAQLSQLCALFRFADSLDVDHTRVPADFLLNETEGRRPLQDVEDCKRQVSADVQIDAGTVSVRFFCAAPNLETLQTLSSFAERWHRGQARTQPFRLLTRLWPGKPREKLTQRQQETQALVKQLDEGSQANCVLCVQDIQDNRWPCYSKSVENVWRSWLQTYFESVEGPAKADPKLQTAMASAAAVLVLLELRDEYKAIEDVGLQQAVRLGQVTWATSAERLPSVLTRP